MMISSKLLLLVLFIAGYGHVAADSNPAPVILVPGDGGCRAFGQPADDPHGDPKLLWMNLLAFAHLEETTKKLSLKYDPVTRKVSDADGMKISFLGWGYVENLEYLDKLKLEFTSYFVHLIEALKKDPYYKSGTTLRGAPYDFRKGPKHNPGFVPQFKSLVEETYELNGQRPVVILSHSMGNLVTWDFLRNQTLAWKDKYVKAIVAVAAPYGGSVRSVLTLASGDSFGIPLLNALHLRELQRSMPSLGLLFPDPRFWSPDEVLIQTPGVNYTAHQYAQLYKDLKLNDGYQMMLDAKDDMDMTKGPTGIKELYCVHGVDVPTIGKLVYKPESWFRKPFPDQSPKKVMEDGDGTVNRRSLEICKNWKGVKYSTISGAQHTPILKHAEFIPILREATGSKLL